MSRRKILAVASPIALAMGLSGCAMGGAIPGANTPITQSEEQQGREYHSQILQEFGGAMQGNSANYVRDVGQKIAVQSGLANTPGAFTVSLLNSSVNNAFATTGGYVYTTRQLVTLMNNEAELAGVLGHEVGHVAARHAQRRQQAQQQNTLLGAAGAILSGILLGDSQLGSTLGRAALQGSQLLTLGFSRDQEREADELGVSYLSRAGYDPMAMSTVLESLARQSSLDAQLQGRDSANLPVKLGARSVFGGTVTLELEALGWPAEVMEVELSRDAWQALDAQPGDTLFVHPRQLQTVTCDGNLGPRVTPA